MTTPNFQMDLLAIKTGEFDKLPGLLLGLDGWILRSIPQELRKQFLESYLKNLRITFHPDRYQDEAIKRSRQNYLQAVSEAVDFMSRDEFSFELASDAVPTKRNPFVALQQSLGIRESVIASLNSQIAELNTGAQRTDTEFKKLLMDHLRLEEKLKQIEKRDRHLRTVMSNIINLFPVPLDCPGHSVRGFFVDTDKIMSTRKDDPEYKESLRALLERYSTEDYSLDQTKVKKWRPFLRQCGGKTVELSFRRRKEIKGYTICGATSLPHLCEFLRNQRSNNSDWLQQAFALFFNRPSNLDANDASSWRGSVGPYILSFYTPHCFLLIQEKDKETQRLTPTLRLFYVTYSSFSAAPDAAIERTLKGEITVLRTTLVFAREQMRKARTERMNLKHDIKRLEKLVKSYDL